jgi:cation diffusion facilitator CzcD-associated flavoprotein CzcO
MGDESTTATLTRSLRIVIIGAGPGGLCMGKRLLDEGLDNFVILERSDGVGGTWNFNRYPGCECDVPSALYSFSFAVKPDWSKPYGTQPEILDYMRDLASKHGLLPHCRFGSTVTGATWDEIGGQWTVDLDDGTAETADFVVSAIGMFNGLSWPSIDGLDSFQGTMFHSGQWDWEHDLTSRRIAVIGSAASAVQFVPEIVEQAGQVHLFQRTANWVLPKADTPYTAEQLEAFRADPAPILAFRAEVESNMNKGMTFAFPSVNAEREAIGRTAIDVVIDPDVRRRLVPDHPYGCKRPLASNRYYPAFNRPNLELVTDPIERITATGVVTADGVEREVDTIIIATGYTASRYISALDLVGRNGQHISEAWSDGAQAYAGMSTSGFPNLFMLYGPNTNNGSILTMIEHQVDHVLAHLRRMLADDILWVDVTPAAMRAFNDEIQAAIAGVTVWQAGCHGYYRSPSGRIVTQWPFSMTEFQRRTATLDPSAYEVAVATRSNDHSPD